MTQVTFYLLDEYGQDAGAFACRLIDKIWRAGLSVHVHMDSEARCKTMDNTLWQWREAAFIPHALEGDPPLESPVTLGFKPPKVTERKVLINLSEEVPAFYTEFARVCEVVVQNPEFKAVSRKKFQSYRQAGITPETHAMPSRAP